MYQLTPRGTENSTTLFTSAVTLIDIDDRCSDDIVVRRQSPAHQHIIKVTIASIRH